MKHLKKFNECFLDKEIMLITKPEFDELYSYIE
jgi:hypothetical protein